MTAVHREVEVTDRAQWRAWLMANHHLRESIWLIFPRKGAGPDWLSNDDIVEEALCFGWIDSLPRSRDESRSMLRISPRKPGSAWSALNKRRAGRMIEVGLMMPQGLAAIEAAKRNGQWDALNAVEALNLPPDLVAALQAKGDAMALFEGFPRSVKRGILEWIAAAKRPATRQARIVTTATMAAENRRANQWRG